MTSVSDDPFASGLFKLRLLAQVAKGGRTPKVEQSSQTDIDTETETETESVAILSTANYDDMNGEVDSVLEELNNAHVDLKFALGQSHDSQTIVNGTFLEPIEEVSDTNMTISVSSEENGHPRDLVQILTKADPSFPRPKENGRSHSVTSSIDSNDQSDAFSENSEDSLTTRAKPISRLPVFKRQDANTSLETSCNGTDTKRHLHSFKSAASMIHCTNVVSKKKEKEKEKEKRKAAERKRSSSLVDMKSAGLKDNKNPVPRDNASSRKRLEAMGVKSAEDAQPEPDYMTPLQRKDTIIKDLKTELKDIHKVYEDKVDMVEMKMDGLRFEYEEKLVEKDDLIRRLEISLNKLEDKYTTMNEEKDELSTQLHELTMKHEDFKETTAAKEIVHQEMYLEMYKKGMDSARFERRDELEVLAKSENTDVSVSELLEKVKIKEAELEWWQSARRNELYQETVLPETTADATLRFLRDSMYHYLISGPHADQHLKAIISIFKYTEAQMKTITRAGEKKKKKSTS